MAPSRTQAKRDSWTHAYEDVNFDVPLFGSNNGGSLDLSLGARLGGRDEERDAMLPPVHGGGARRNKDSSAAFGLGLGNKASLSTSTSSSSSPRTTPDPQRLQMYSTAMTTSEATTTGPATPPKAPRVPVLAHTHTSAPTSSSAHNAIPTPNATANASILHPSPAASPAAASSFMQQPLLASSSTPAPLSPPHPHGDASLHGLRQPLLMSRDADNARFSAGPSSSSSSTTPSPAPAPGLSTSSSQSTARPPPSSFQPFAVSSLSMPDSAEASLLSSSSNSNTSSSSGTSAPMAPEREGPPFLVLTSRGGSLGSMPSMPIMPNISSVTTASSPQPRRAVSSTLSSFPSSSSPSTNNQPAFAMTTMHPHPPNTSANNNSHSPPTSPFARPGSRGSTNMYIQRIASEESRVLAASASANSLSMGGLPTRASGASGSSGRGSPTPLLHAYGQPGGGGLPGPSLSSRGSMILYHVAIGDDGALERPPGLSALQHQQQQQALLSNPFNHAGGGRNGGQATPPSNRHSSYSMSGDSIISLSGDSKYPVGIGHMMGGAATLPRVASGLRTPLSASFSSPFNPSAPANSPSATTSLVMSSGGLVAYAYDPDDDASDDDEEDWLHDPDVAPYADDDVVRRPQQLPASARSSSSGASTKKPPLPGQLHQPPPPALGVYTPPGLSLRGLVNVATLVVVVGGILSLFVIYPITKVYNDNGVSTRILGNTRINATGQAVADAGDGVFGREFEFEWEEVGRR